MDGLISNIQRFSIHDGPGIRTTVFLKGCNLSCFWCHNPECLSSNIELQFFSNKCVYCMECINACPQSVHSFENNKRIVRREKCIVCGNCVRVCPSKALLLSGKRVTVEELINMIDRDRPFYNCSGGGVTFSGGEPLIQKNFLKDILIQCKKRDYHTAIESAANVTWSFIEDIYDLVDLFIIDIKTMDNKIHKTATGADNTLTLSNLEKLNSLNSQIWIRTPIISGINDDVKSIKDIAEFIKILNRVTKVELITFHKLAINKYESLGMKYNATEMVPPSSELIGKLNDVLKEIRIYQCL